MQTAIFASTIVRTDLNQTIPLFGIRFFNFTADIMEVLIVHS